MSERQIHCPHRTAEGSLKEHSAEVCSDVLSGEGMKRYIVGALDRRAGGQETLAFHTSYCLHCFLEERFSFPDISVKYPVSGTG